MAQMRPHNLFGGNMSLTTTAAVNSTALSAALAGALLVEHADLLPDWAVETDFDEPEPEPEIEDFNSWVEEALSAGVEARKNRAQAQLVSIWGADLPNVIERVGSWMKAQEELDELSRVHARGCGRSKKAQRRYLARQARIDELGKTTRFLNEKYWRSMCCASTRKPTFLRFYRKWLWTLQLLKQL